MSVGVIVGRVYNSNNKGVKATVQLNKMIGYGESDPMGLSGEDTYKSRSSHSTSILTESNSKGDFILPFIWNSTNVAETQARKVDLYISAMTDIKLTGGTTYCPMSRKVITGYVVKDMLSVGGVTSPFGSLPDLLDFAKDLIQAFNKLKYRSLFKLEMLTSEGYLIIAGCNIWIKTD